MSEWTHTVPVATETVGAYSDLLTDSVILNFIRVIFSIRVNDLQLPVDRASKVSAESGDSSDGFDIFGGWGH